LLSKQASAAVGITIQSSIFVCVCTYTLLAACEWQSSNKGASN